jgi:hypothetical protein
MVNTMKKFKLHKKKVEDEDTWDMPTDDEDASDDSDAGDSWLDDEDITTPTTKLVAQSETNSGKRSGKGSISGSMGSGSLESGTGDVKAAKHSRFRVHSSQKASSGSQKTGPNEIVGRGQNRMMQVTIGYNDHGVSQSDLLMEVVASRDIVPADWDNAKWSSYLHSVGQVPFYILAGDPDRYHLCIYAAEVLRKTRSHAEKHSGLDEVNRDRGRNIGEHQDEIDGVTWGGVDGEEVEGDFGITHSGRPSKPKTVRDQITQSTKLTTELHQQAVAPSALAENNDKYLYRWQQAEKIARTLKRDEWQGKVDHEFEAMINYCYNWLRDIADVPKPYPKDGVEMTNMFWAQPKILAMGEREKERRDKIVEKIITFWHKSVKKNGEGINLKSQSYRTVLAAMKLDRLIEQYADNYKRFAREQPKGQKPVLEIPDEELESQIRKAATEYFRAHFPVELEGAKPGPITTSDPDYPEYIRLCKKYNLKEGVYLHEQGL